MVECQGKNARIYSDRSQGAATEDAAEGDAQQRFEKFLQALEKKGISQAKAALQVKVPAQYFSDVKLGRRSLSELFARRLEQVFGIDHAWLLGKVGTMEIPALDQNVKRPEGDRVWLPILAHPIAGDPKAVPDWDGSSAELVGVAAARSFAAVQPYVLRFGATDCRERLQPGDLLLISQAVCAEAEIEVLETRRKLFLARRGPENTWEPLNPKNVRHGVPHVVGHCLGIIWSDLSRKSTDAD